MPRADSTIFVNIVGDAKSLTTAAETSTGAIGGLNKKLVGLGVGIGVAFAVDKVFEFGGIAVQEADRVSDAASRLEKQLGKLSQPLIDAADEFHTLGQSEGDMLELEARIVDIGTAAGIADADLAPLAVTAAELAAKMALVTDTDAAGWIDKIGKALATGDFRVLKDLGINITDAAVAAQALMETGKDLPELLTETEIATARANLVMAELAKLYGDVGTGAADVEQKQADLNARFETFTGDVGGAVEGPLSDLLGVFLFATDLFADAAEKITGAGIAFDSMLAPVKALIVPVNALSDALAGAISLLERLFELAPSGIDTPLPRGSATPLRSRQFQPGGTVIQVQGGSPEVIEQSVRRALQQATSRSGSLE